MLSAAGNVGDAQRPSVDDCRTFAAVLQFVCSLLMGLPTNRSQLIYVINAVADSDALKTKLLDEGATLKAIVRRALRRKDTTNDRLLYAQLVCSLSRNGEDCAKVCACIEDVPKAVRVMLRQLWRPKEEAQNPLAYLLLNLTQSKEVRQHLLTVDLSPMLNIAKNGLYWQRHCVILMLRNLCIDHECHESVARSKDVLLTALMYPLFGDGDYSKATEEIWPPWRQYLNADKKRDSAELRVGAVEALFQLCNSRLGREALRQMGAYYVLREYHKWETLSNAIETCLSAIGLLIRTEEEIGCDVITRWASEMERSGEADNSSPPPLEHT